MVAVERNLDSIPSRVDTVSAAAAQNSAAGTKTVYNESLGLYSRPPTSSGGRNMQDSSFSFTTMSDSSVSHPPPLLFC